MRPPYINLHRNYQALQLFPLLQQASVPDGLPPPKTDSRPLYWHRVLQFLGQSMTGPDHPERHKNPLYSLDTCFPSLVAIARATGLSVSTVRRALDDLIELGFITKSRIPGHKLRKGKGQNKYEGCRYHVVPEVWDFMESPFDPKKKKMRADPTTLSTSICTSDSTKATELQAVAQATLAANHEADRVLSLLKEKVGDHPSFNKSDHMRKSINGVIADAGGVEHVIAFIESLAPIQVPFIKASTYLGRYLRSLLSEWLKRDPDHVRDEDDRVDDTVASNGEPPNFYKLIEVIREVFPDHICLSTEDNVTSLRHNLMNCVALAGNMKRAFNVLVDALDGETDQRIAEMHASEDIGVTLETEFPSWLERFRDEVPATGG